MIEGFHLLFHESGPAPLFHPLSASFSQKNHFFEVFQAAPNCPLWSEYAPGTALQVEKKFTRPPITWDESVFLAKKIPYHFRQAFWYGKGVRYHQKKFQNRAIRGFWENVRFVRSNGRKNTFEWPKVVSEVSFPRFWGVLSIAKCFRCFVSVIRSVVSEI